MNWILSRKEDLSLDLHVSKHGKTMKVNKSKIEKLEYIYNYITAHGSVFDSIHDNGNLYFIVQPNLGRN